MFCGLRHNSTKKGNNLRSANVIIISMIPFFKIIGRITQVLCILLFLCALQGCQSPMPDTDRNATETDALLHQTNTAENETSPCSETTAAHDFAIVLREVRHRRKTATVRGLSCSIRSPVSSEKICFRIMSVVRTPCPPNVRRFCIGWYGTAKC